MRSNTFFVFNHFSTRVGKIKDMSLGGIGFEFMHKLGADFSPEVIDIFSSVNGNYYLAGLPCRAIYSVFCESRDTDNRQYQMCRCGIEFQDLNEKQKKEIQILLDDEQVWRTKEG